MKSIHPETPLKVSQILFKDKLVQFLSCEEGIGCRKKIYIKICNDKLSVLLPTWMTIQHNQKHQISEWQTESEFAYLENSLKYLIATNLFGKSY